MDLQLSLGHVRMNLEGVKKDDTTWDITVHMNDVYDYDLFNYFNDSGDTLKLKKMDDLIITFINNGAYLLQQTNQLHEYEWDITYSFEYKTD